MQDNLFKIIDNGSVTTPSGFRASSAACGLKKNKTDDIALIVSDTICTAAGVFTRNKVKGHSLLLTMENISKGNAQAVVINSGNANACIGAEGEKAALFMAEKTASLAGCAPSHVITGSTGVIGIPLDTGRVAAGIDLCFGRLSASGGHDAALAIMTTDLISKEACVQINTGGTPVNIAGMAKGSGMIHPDMATMISIITTDAAIDASVLDIALRQCVDSSFNCISVDGDTSVCDMVVALANGKAGNSGIQLNTPDYSAFFKGLSYVCTTLAKMVAADGEGATKLIEIRVLNAPTADDAKLIADAIAKSPLVKTAVFGEDANWGRIITAAGYSGAQINPHTIDILLGDVMVCQNGKYAQYQEAAAKKQISGKEALITVDLKSGSACRTVWTCDFSYDYVKINGSYRS